MSDLRWRTATEEIAKALDRVVSPLGYSQTLEECAAEAARLLLALRWINVRDCQRFDVVGCIDEELPMEDWCAECLAHHAIDGGAFPSGDASPEYPADHPKLRLLQRKDD